MVQSKSRRPGRAKAFTFELLAKENLSPSHGHDNCRVLRGSSAIGNLGPQYVDEPAF